MSPHLSRAQLRVLGKLSFEPRSFYELREPGFGPLDALVKRRLVVKVAPPPDRPTKGKPVRVLYRKRANPLLMLPSTIAERKMRRTVLAWISQCVGRAKKRGLSGEKVKHPHSKDNRPIALRCCELLIERHYARMRRKGKK